MKNPRDRAKVAKVTLILGLQIPRYAAPAGGIIVFQFSEPEARVPPIFMAFSTKGREKGTESPPRYARATRPAVKLN